MFVFFKTLAIELFLVDVTLLHIFSIFLVFSFFFFIIVGIIKNEIAKMQ